MSSSATLIESTFRTTRKSLLQRLQRRLGCRQTAEDLVQEAYLRVLQQDSIEAIGNLSAYVFRIAGHLAIDHGRQAAARAKAQHEPLAEDLMCPKPWPDRVAEADQELDLLRQRIAELPPQCRRIFLLHKVQHLSYGEIAKALALSPRTVETQVGKALKLLRDHRRPP